MLSKVGELSTVCCIKLKNLLRDVMVVSRDQVSYVPESRVSAIRAWWCMAIVFLMHCAIMGIALICAIA